MTTSAPEAEEVIYCAVHTDVETTLHCNKCGRPMCIRCAVQMPVGYRCKECVRGQQAVFYTAGNADYAIAAAVSLGLGFVGGLFAAPLGFFFAIILGPVAGGIAATAVRWATKRRRGQYTAYIVVAGMVVGGLLGGLASQWSYIQYLLMAQSQPGMPQDMLLSSLGNILIGPLLFVGIAAGVAYSWFRYGR